MKRMIVIEIDCGNKTCQDCDWHKDGDCAMWESSLEEDILRDPRCLEAERKAIDLSIEACHKREVSA